MNFADAIEEYLYDEEHHQEMAEEALQKAVDAGRSQRCGSVEEGSSRR